MSGLTGALRTGIAGTWRDGAIPGTRGEAVDGRFVGFVMADGGGAPLAGTPRDPSGCAEDDVLSVDEAFDVAAANPGLRILAARRPEGHPGPRPYAGRDRID